MSSFTHSPSKQDYVTILAIYDDPPSSKSNNVNTTIVSTSLPEEKTKKPLKLEIASNHEIKNQQRKRNDGSPFIDVKSLDMPPSSIGLQVQHSEVKFSNLAKPHSEKNSRKHQNGEAMSVHFAPTQKKDPDKSFQEENWRQNNSRKSRIGDNFLDAKEKIDLEQNELKKWSSFLQVDPSNYRFQKIVLSPETKDLSMGLEISAVPNPQRPSHLLAVEVRKIEQRGRIAEDGQLRVCDQIVDINGTPCDQISFARARLHLRDLQSIPEPSLSFFRRINSKKPNISPKLEQFKLKKGENTSRVGFCKEIKLIKEEDGFGFSYAGRLNASEQHLYYIKGLRKNLDLSLGDRILKINGIDLSNLNQSQVTSLLKKIPIGETISLTISQTEEKTPEKQQNEEKEEKENLKEKTTKNLFEELKQMIGEKQEILQMLIPLNETPGAGLGISVKAQRIGCNDLGLYVRSILHGSAAFKDGRLKVNDRLAGIEEVNLLNFSLNGEALDAFMGTLSQIPTNKKKVLLFIARIKEEENLNKISQTHQSRWGSDSELSQKEQFVRDSVTRRSISEKRPLGQHSDPSHLRTYQRILHQRQTSAPAVSSVFRSRRSLHEPLNISSPEEPRSRKSRPRTTFYDGDCSTKYEIHSQTLPSPKNHQTTKIVCPGSYSPQRKFPSSALSSSKSQPDSLSTPKSQQQKNENGKRRGSLGSGLFKLFSRTHSCKEDSPNKNKPKPSHQQRQQQHPPQYFHNPTSPPYSAYGFWPHCFPPPVPHSFNQNCTNRPHSPLPSSIAPPGILHWTQSFRCPQPSFNSQLHGHGPVEVPHWRQGENNLLRHQQIHPRHQQMFPLTITTHLTPGSQPHQIRQNYSAGFNNSNNNNHHLHQSTYYND
ncbi:hypothetical protein ACQ4LE_002588, partial [Meloidogyne hapla]